MTLLLISDVILQRHVDYVHDVIFFIPVIAFLYETVLKSRKNSF